MSHDQLLTSYILCPRAYHYRNKRPKNKSCLIKQKYLKIVNNPKQNEDSLNLAV